ncbi:VOC family protein [Bradyrhizobium sp. U87765 SZCCT0131]|uniref:VOC family protein n=1 Tax=unclassified Bradyrhizobium TaxID=2631580 RepID=UPI001BAA01AC|nr:MULTISPECIES: VOC family protein [unclassified Bradyrhizobium]MBR1220734.1 VOC family protein [Bradyrhizobium sp. U87765 SZCCT0131]MBR1260446.1 VOC family protein [Bradyrhizobium sp. U87765 SZCCT0134]MBR1307305.1 VOC family protein [Bradyrhizobium sp. U87765 SZCCT0110]MBR1321259.1 VOC family protein [Bradyrhizobium sp. U87765 SZCCT0109]MBR1349572.1 VOC family protein [Bradyrhizobium sp. U87765 SZCCT0048]
MSKLTTSLWFDGNAEEAATFYTSVFKDAKITSVSRYGDAGPGPKGSVMVVAFELNGQSFIGINGGPQFKFSPAISLVVNCETQDEIDHYWDRLLEGGAPQQCGWLTDKFGLSWQVVPTIIGEVMKDPEKGNRAMAAVMKMVKLDIAEILRAAA